MVEIFNYLKLFFQPLDLLEIYGTKKVTPSVTRSLSLYIYIHTYIYIMVVFRHGESLTIYRFILHSSYSRLMGITTHLFT